MYPSSEFAAYVMDLLMPLGELKAGKFFGGFGFKIGTKQFAMIMENTLYFCVNDESRPKYEALGMLPFSYLTKKSRIQVRKYYSVPTELFEDQEKLLEWANEAVRSAYSA